MQLTSSQAGIITPFITQTVECLKSMADIHAEAGEGFEDELASFRFKGYAVAADMSGRCAGTVLIHFYPETALAVGNRLMAKILGITEEQTDIDGDLQDALAEWGNTVIGLSTREIAKFDPEINFAPPYFVLDTQAIDQALVNVQEIISVPVFTQEVGRFYFNCLMQTPSGQSNAE